MPKLSIIMPVYNVAPYLPQCLDSIIKQTFNDFELIIVEDGSTDKSQEIIKQYAKDDGRLKPFFHTHNQGVSAARNDGLKAAQGEFITFVDSDDWLEPEMYEKMLAKQKETNADIVECNLTHRVEKGADHLELINSPEKFSFYDSGVDGYLLNIYHHRLAAAIFNKVYRRSLIINNDLHFVGNDKVQMEDLLFLLSLAHYSPHIACLEKSYYNYRHNTGSLSRHKIPKLLEKIATLLEHYQQVLKKRGDNMPPSLALLMTTHIRYALFYAIIQEKNPLKPGTEALRQAAQNKLLKNFIAYSLKSMHTNFPDRIFATLFTLKLYRLTTLLYFILLIIKNRTYKIYKV